VDVVRELAVLALAHAEAGRACCIERSQVILAGRFTVSTQSGTLQAAVSMLQWPAVRHLKECPP
jgi:hypothetical protein